MLEYQNSDFWFRRCNLRTGTYVFIIALVTKHKLVEINCVSLLSYHCGYDVFIACQINRYVQKYHNLFTINNFYEP